MWAETLQVDGRELLLTRHELNYINVGEAAALTRAELENAIIFPHDDRVLCVDGFESGPCPYPEGPVFVWLTLDQHARAKELLA